MRYLFREAFSHNGVYFEAGKSYELPPETVAALPEGIAEKLGSEVTKLIESKEPEREKPKGEEPEGSNPEDNEENPANSEQPSSATRSTTKAPKGSTITK